MLLKKIITKKFFLTNKGLYIYTIIKNKHYDKAIPNTRIHKPKRSKNY